jgi:hypothetical protein
MIAALLLSIGTGTAFGGDHALPACAESPDADAQAELAALYDGRQDASASASAKRVKATWKLYKKGRICTADDHYKAGLLLLASRKPDVLEVAHELAMVATHSHVDRSRWLVMNAMDRWQIALGRPQPFGTQVGQGGMCLYPIDTAFSDDDRKAWGGKAIESVYAEYLESRSIDGAPTATTMNDRSLFCRLDAW